MRTDDNEQQLNHSTHNDNGTEERHCHRDSNHELATWFGARDLRQVHPIFTADQLPVQ
ncbi:MAG TPA: hypothetical protein VJT15_13440 [Pyrinomonadaceae bacterium]|nr:hypothetical protein [Pyrinomonadaceae bacterium]